jgi:uncharacterized protein involved in response to NO
MNTTQKENYFFSQPHQPFFILGVANAIVMMLVFALSYKGIFSLELSSTIFHVYSLVYLVFTNVFVGFLFTTFPRFNQTQVIQKQFYTNIFYANALGAVLFLVGAFVSHILVVAAMTLLLVSEVFIVKQLHSIYKQGMAPDKSDSFWILNASYFGLLANILFVLGEFFPQLQSSAINIAFYLYLIFLAFSVGQRMIPFFSHSFAQKNENFVKIIFVLFIAKSIFSASGITQGEIVVDLILSGYMAREFYRWELHPFNSPAILWVLHLALAWLPLAFLLSAISLTAELVLETSFYFLNIHLLAIGFLTTVLIGFGTRVTLGHSGQPPHGDALATKIFIFIQFVVLARALFSINIAFGWGLNFLFDISFSLWLVLFMVWGGRYFKTLAFGSKV